MAITSIVVGIDGSESSLRALAMALGLARREEASVHACLVSPLLPTGVSYGFVVAPDVGERDPEFERSLRAQLEEAGVAGSFEYATGDVADELERLADSYRADLVVVGRSKHPHLHMGGIPRRLINTARHPILVVP